MSTLEGKIALVTGASRGIGAAIATLFAQEGATVALHGRDLAALSAVRAGIERAGGRVLPVTADVTEFPEIEAMRRRIEGELGPVETRSGFPKRSKGRSSTCTPSGGSARRTTRRAPPGFSRRTRPRGSLGLFSTLRAGPSWYDSVSAGSGHRERGGRVPTGDNDRRIDYVEFGATDIGRTKQFYQQVFGWRFEDYGPDYTSFQDGRLTGGFTKDAPVRAANPLVVIYATELEAIEAKVKQAGGKIVRTTYSFPGGRRFHFSDPSGNELAVWTDR